MPAANLNLIFEKWKASLQQKNRKREAVSANFDELFDELNSVGATFDEAHAFLQPAIKVHLPTPSLAKVQWKLLKNNPINSEMTEKEFVEGWHKDISDKATNSFYHVFPLPVDKDEDPEPKVYGSMSAKEYKLQRRNAESYPILNTEELEKRLQQLDAFDPANDILGEDSGDGKSE